MNKGINGLESGMEIITHIGTGLKKPTKVKAEVTGADEEQVAYKILDVLEKGSADRDPVGEIFGTENTGDFEWEEA